MTSELALVDGLRRGESAAFDRAYELYSARVFSFVLRLTQRRDLAEDLVQETWLRLATHAPKLREDTRLCPWLFTVARNLHVSHRRWRLLDRERLFELSLSSYRRTEDESPFDLAAANQTEQRLEAALAALPVRYREVILLVVVERMTPSEAAEVLRVKPATLRQRLARARGMIAEALDAAKPRPAARAADEKAPS